MNDESTAAGREPGMGAELAELRNRLRSSSAPRFEDTGLPAALRARRARAAVEMPPAPKRTWRWGAPVAAAAALAVAAVAALVTMRTVAPNLTGVRPPPAAARPALAERAAFEPAFQPLLYGPGFSPSGSYSVVRVRIPLSALAQGPRLEGAIEADLLVGEDGLASGIRFASTDTQIGSERSQ